MPRVKYMETTVRKIVREEIGVPMLNFQSCRKITCLDRAILGIFTLRQIRSFPDQTDISLSDLMQTITNQARENNEVLSKHTRDYTADALERMARSRYIVFLPDDEDGDICFIIHPAFKAVLIELDDLMIASGQFTSLSVFDMNQYRTLCTFFHQLTTSRRLPMKKRLTHQDYLRELEKHRGDTPLMLDLQKLETDTTFRAEVRDAIRARYC